jgi:hypothetical protein
MSKAKKNALIQAGIRGTDALEVRRDGGVLVEWARKVVREPSAREVGRHFRFHLKCAADSRDPGTS